MNNYDFVETDLIELVMDDVINLGMDYKVAVCLRDYGTKKIVVNYDYFDKELPIAALEIGENEELVEMKLIDLLVRLSDENGGKRYEDK